MGKNENEIDSITLAHCIERVDPFFTDGGGRRGGGGGGANKDKNT